VEAVALGGGATLAEAARRTGLHRSTAHHLLRTLARLGYVRQDAASRAYQLGPRPFLLTRRSGEPDHLARLAEPYLAELVRRAREDASLAVYRDGAVTVVLKREHAGPVRVVEQPGAHRPIHCAAVAKAILPWLPPAEQAALLARARFERYTPRTITRRSALEAHLARVRAAGYALDDEEHIEGVRCIAAPVFGAAGQAVASMCVLGPRSRLTHQRLRELRRPLTELARALSRELGWEAPPGALRARPRGTAS
jgi:DNA-binding IclR family transcriptional regulator